MSHFYLYPLLASQGYSSFQIQRILHSFGLIANHPFQTQLFFSPSSCQENVVNKPCFSRNLIIQQNYQTISQLEGISQNRAFQLDSKNNSSRQDLIKQEHYESHQKTSEGLANEKDDQQSIKNPITRKKKRIVKMSLRQKRDKQLKRNRTQNSKRNVIPNQIHQMLSILFKKKKSYHLVQKLIQKYSVFYSIKSLSAQRFYLYQSLLKQKINHYANEHSLRILLQPLEPAFKIYEKQQQSVYCRMGLSLIKYFLNNEANLVILNSKRIKSENKLEHLKTKRLLKHNVKTMHSDTFLSQKLSIRKMILYLISIYYVITGLEKKNDNNFMFIDFIKQIQLNSMH